MDNIITQIVVVTRDGVEIVSVGSNGVEKINDDSKEWEDGIDFIYNVYGKDDKLLKQIINCPMYQDGSIVDLTDRHYL